MGGHDRERLPTLKEGCSLGRCPFDTKAHFWTTSDRLSERPRKVHPFSGTSTRVEVGSNRPFAAPKVAREVVPLGVPRARREAQVDPGRHEDAADGRRPPGVAERAERAEREAAARGVAADREAVRGGAGAEAAVVGPQNVLERLGGGDVRRPPVLGQRDDAVAGEREAEREVPVPGQEKGETFPTLEARISVVFHSFWLIFGRAIISRGELKAWMLSSRTSLREHPR